MFPAQTRIRDKIRNTHLHQTCFLSLDLAALTATTRFRSYMYTSMLAMIFARLNLLAKKLSHFICSHLLCSQDDAEQRNQNIPLLFRIAVHQVSFLPIVGTIVEHLFAERDGLRSLQQISAYRCRRKLWYLNLCLPHAWPEKCGCSPPP